MTENQQIQDNQDQPKWFIDEGIPGTGDRPSWLPEKFKTVADMAKSNAELEKKLGTAPENYDFSKSKFIDPDYVPFQELQNIAKEKRVPQEFIDKMLESVDKYVSEFSTDKEEEIKKLGENAKDRLFVLDNWAKANLSKESYEALTNSLTNADAIKALEEIRGKMMSNNVQVPNGNGQINNADSLDEITKELSTNLEKYKTDEKYKKDIEKRLEIASKNQQNFVDKIGA